MFSPTLKKLYFCSLIFTCIVIAHILTIIYLAFYHNNKSYQYLASNYQLHRFSEVRENEVYLRGRDNLFHYYICPFNIRHKALSINIKNDTTNYWSLALYSSHGNLIYSLNNNLIQHKNLNLIMGSQLALALLKKYYNNPVLDQATFLPRDAEKGFAILKIKADNANENKQAQILGQSSSCQALM